MCWFLFLNVILLFLDEFCKINEFMFKIFWLGLYFHVLFISYTKSAGQKINEINNADKQIFEIR